MANKGRDQDRVAAAHGGRQAGSGIRMCPRPRSCSLGDTVALCDASWQFAMSHVCNRAAPTGGSTDSISHRQQPGPHPTTSGLAPHPSLMTAVVTLARQLASKEAGSSAACGSARRAGLGWGRQGGELAGQRASSKDAGSSAARGRREQGKLATPGWPAGPLWTSRTQWDEAALHSRPSQSAQPETHLGNQLVHHIGGGAADAGVGIQDVGNGLRGERETEHDW